MEFVKDQEARLPEDRRTECKGVYSKSPLNTIKNTADEYAVGFLNREGGSIYWGISDKSRVVEGVPLTDEERDELQRMVENKLREIQPPVPLDTFRLAFHAVKDADGNTIPGLLVVELAVLPGEPLRVYATSSNDVFLKGTGVNPKLRWPEILHLIRARQALVDPTAMARLLDAFIHRTEAVWPPDDEFASLYLIVDPVTPEPGMLLRVLQGRDGNNVLLEYGNEARRVAHYNRVPNIGVFGWRREQTGWRSIDISHQSGRREAAWIYIEGSGRMELFCARAAQRLVSHLPPGMLVLLDDLVFGQTAQTLYTAGSIYRDAGFERQLIRISAAVVGTTTGNRGDA